MEWYYALDNRQMGPVNEDQFAELVRQGVITPATPVWRMGMAGWLPYGQVTGQWPMAGKSTSDTVDFQGNLPARPTPEAWEKSLSNQDYNLSISLCLSEGWQLFQKNMPMGIVAVSLVCLLLLVIKWIPGVGNYCFSLLMVPLLGGLTCYYLRLLRGKDVSVSDAFCAFGPRFLPVLLVAIVQNLIRAVCIMPFIIVFTWAIFSSGQVTLEGLAHLSELPPLQQSKYLAGVFEKASFFAMLLSAVTGLVSFFLVVLLTILLQCSPVLVLDKGLDFFAALKLSVKRVFRNFKAMLLLFLISGGILVVELLPAFGAVFYLVVFFMLSWLLATLAVVYEKIFPGQTTEQS